MTRALPFYISYEIMRYHTEKPVMYRMPRHGYSYHCRDHPVYESGTIYFHDGKGFVVIQQRYDEKTRHTWWGEIDSWLVEEIYRAEAFPEFFKQHAKEPEHGYFPTFTVRQVMWALHMKPLKKRAWETVFDHKPI